MKLEDKNLLLIGFAALALIVILFPKEYASSGGLAGLPKNKECGCVGIKFSYYPEGCFDCGTAYYCAGIPHSCQCFDIRGNATVCS